MSDSESRPRRKIPRRPVEIEEGEITEEFIEPVPPRRTSRKAAAPVEPDYSYQEPEPAPAKKRTRKAAPPPEEAAEPAAPRKRTRKAAAPAPAVVEPASPRPSLLGRIFPKFANKPRLEVKAGAAAKQVKQEKAKQPLTIWNLLIGLLPVWALLIMIIILEPALPFRAVGAVINWGLGLLPERPAYDTTEPVFIVENPNGLAPQSDLPPPNWSLELSPVFTSEIQYWEDKIAQWSVAYRIKPNMIATIMQIESCGNPQAVSGAGAMGLFQVMPFHFQAGEDSYDPDTNAGRGMLFLGEMLATANGDPGLAFAAYNGGPSLIFRSPIDWPSETQDYQFWASGIYEEAELGLEASPTLSEWIEAGGSSLCADASTILGLTP